MSRIQKRFQRIINNPTDIKWDQIVTIIEHYGLVAQKPQTGGSHWLVFDENDFENTMITVPVHGNRIKVVYAKKIIALIKSFTEDEED